MRNNSRIHRWIVLGAALAVTGMTPAFASADDGMPQRPRFNRGLDGSRERIIEQLNLTEEQQDKLGDLRAEARKQATLDRGKMAGLRSQLKVEFMENDVNASKVRSLNREISDLQAKMSERRLDQRLAMLEVLTPEQREMWQELREERPGRGQGPGMRGGKGMRGRGHGRMHGDAGPVCDGKGPKGAARGRGAGNCPHGGPGLGKAQGCTGQGPRGGGDFGFLLGPLWDDPWNDAPMDGEVDEVDAGLPESESR